MATADVEGSALKDTNNSGPKGQDRINGSARLGKRTEEIIEEHLTLSGYSETNKTRIEELQKKVTDKNEKIKEIEKENRCTNWM
ncbi:hypothetical protein MAR_028233 [Mya arenaria]|uniref:Uncharacterized protein n=1 Tax=Mya arenaria TaxID=6604 RepID=A0ABY7DF51_MYAAR|nr:hypothetical protein MAR_028233 [Mya arenaria]